ncbi:MAG: FAD-dependent oxidoreductase, partial [Candidatus Eremiobacteraeota bacterium]|nr:FAD-dependent oxidoreductase [Candidatus Eremiobacteraeota bacterium]
MCPLHGGAVPTQSQGPVGAGVHGSDRDRRGDRRGSGDVAGLRPARRFERSPAARRRLPRDSDSLDRGQASEHHPLDRRLVYGRKAAGRVPEVQRRGGHRGNRSDGYQLVARRRLRRADESLRQALRSNDRCRRCNAHVGESRRRSRPSDRCERREARSGVRSLPTVRRVTVTLVTAQACVVGGGPAGMMLTLLLARAGVDVVLLEKHADFLRDFRGDTIHPSTLDLMEELGFLDEFLALPHQEVTSLSGNLGDETIRVADFTHLPTRCKFLAFMPQWDFLDFLARKAKRYPTFQLRMQACAERLLWDGERVAGVRATTADGSLDVRAALTVAADGRDSVLREEAGLEPTEIGAPMDVLWLRLTKRSDDPHDTFGYVRYGRILALIDRGQYWQAAYVIPKGAFERVREEGIESFRASIARTVPFLADRVSELRSWDAIKLLTVRVNRLRTWYRPGFLCIGDAAHAMSPIGGVGINLAIQDAVAAANRLAPKLKHGVVRLQDLRAVQRRRRLAAAATQALQVLIQRNVIGRVL